MINAPTPCASVFSVGSVSSTCPSIIRDVFVSRTPLTMDHPCQYVSNNSCHDHREQRVRCHPVDHGLLALADVSLCLWIMLPCLSGVVLTSVVQVTGCSRCLIGNVGQGFPHLIQKVLGRG